MLRCLSVIRGQAVKLYRNPLCFYLFSSIIIFFLSSTFGWVFYDLLLKCCKFWYTDWRQAMDSLHQFSQVYMEHSSATKLEFNTPGQNGFCYNRLSAILDFKRKFCNTNRPQRFSNTIFPKLPQMIFRLGLTKVV